MVAMDGFDMGVEVYKIPIQAPGELAADGGFATSHESHKKNRAYCHDAPGKENGTISSSSPI
jgi:hypothetical protein